jgi:hypothetical protein
MYFAMRRGILSFSTGLWPVDWVSSGDQGWDYENFAHFFSNLLQRLAKQGKLDSDVEREKGIDLWLRKACIMTRRILVLTAILALFAAPSARADLSITIGSPSISAQGTGTIDVFLTADAATTLYDLGFELNIDDPFGVDSLVEFVEPVPDYHLDPSYVFFGNTAGPAGDTAGSSPATRWVGFDVANSPVSLTVGQDYLLARLNLTHSSLGLPYDPTGQTFQVTLDPSNTFFTAAQLIPVDFTFSSGDITIQGPDASVIPEPGSLLLCAVVALGAAPYLRRRRLAKG